MQIRTRWFPGYSVAAASTVAYIATGPGQTFIVSQINLPLREEFGFGELRLNIMYTVATVVAALPLVWIGAWTDRIGPRVMLALVSLAFGAGCLAMAGAQGLITVFFGFFMLRFFGQGSLSLVSQHALAMWFHRRLGAIHGIKSVVCFAAWVPMPALTVWLISELGWRGAYIVFACAIPLVVVPVSLILVRNRPEDMGLRLDGDQPEATDWTTNEEEIAPDPMAPDPESAADIKPREPGFTLSQARQTRAYWLLAGAFFVPPLIGTAYLFDMQPLLVGRGMSLQTVALVVSAWSLTMAILALPAGAVTDRVHPAALLAGSFGLVAMSSVVLLFAQAPAAAGLAMVLFAIGQSFGSSCASATVARFFGRSHHGAIRSSLMRIAVIGTGIGPVVFGLSARFFGGYGFAMIFFAAVCVPLALAVSALREPQPS